MIKNHMLEVKRKLIKCKDIGKMPSYPYLVNQPVNDLLGIGLAGDMLLWSLDPRRINAFAQFNSFRSS